jgi:excinuclease ABC subunit C
MTTSALDAVTGLGEIRRKALLRHFGSLKRLAAASVDEIAEVSGIGRRTAETIVATFAPERAAPAEASPDPETPAGIEAPGGLETPPAPDSGSTDGGHADVGLSNREAAQARDIGGGGAGGTGAGRGVPVGDAADA